MEQTLIFCILFRILLPGMVDWIGNVGEVFKLSFSSSNLLKISFAKKTLDLHVTMYIYIVAWIIFLNKKYDK